MEMNPIESSNYERDRVMASRLFHRKRVCLLYCMLYQWGNLSHWVMQEYTGWNT